MIFYTGLINAQSRLVIVLGIVGIAILNHYAGYPDNMWWRWNF